MRTILKVALLAVSALLLATVVVADEQDFVGYKYTSDYKRDYDRGFFFGVEAWYGNARNLHFEPVLSTPGGGLGGRLLDLDFDNEIVGRASLGYQANRRLGRFTLRYWDFNDDVARSEVGTGLYAATGTHPTRGDVIRDSFAATADVDVEYAEVEWRKDFAEARRFAAWWSVALNAWEVEYETESWHYNAAAVNQVVHVEDFSSTKAAGIKVGLGGVYSFTDRFSMGASGAIGYSSAEQDAFYLDENAPGAPVGFIERDDTELSLLHFEGDLNFRVRVTGGLEFDWGYRYLDLQDVVARDRFVDNEGKFITMEDDHGLAFEGPYVGIRYQIGLSRIDSDGDTVLDVYDDCKDTPAGAWADASGCPRDLDEDGVYDGLDRCPGTALGTRVDQSGCGVDSDGDTVADGLDLCPNTPGCAIVDGRGCPKDSDGDGVANGCDACPTSAAGSRVDGSGCASDGDADGDTVPDSRDKCPDTTRGATVDSDGCESVVAFMLHFASDSAEINPTDGALLDRVASALAADGGQFEVAGHADSQNTDEYNQGLSERRASAVMEYLAAHGVPAGQLSSVGYSEARPVESNDTDSGRAANRRVEIMRR